MIDNNITKATECDNSTKREKIKAIYPHIVVSGNIDNLYYSIQWYDIDKKSMQDGYGSFTLENVRQWLKDCFEVVDDDIENLINRLEAENKDLFYKIQGVMHFVDKWLEGEELKQDEVCRADIMREKTLKIVEEKQTEIEKLTDDNKFLQDNRWKELSYVRAEAIKEFADRLKNATLPIQIGGKHNYDVISKQGIDHILKEMVGEGG